MILKRFNFIKLPSFYCLSQISPFVSYLISGEILFEARLAGTSLFRQRTFGLLFGPSKSNKKE